MSRKTRKIKAPARTRNDSAFWLVSDEAYDTLCVTGYTSLDKNPEIVAACRCYADLISSMTIHLMSNSEDGDQRIVNELSRKLDINPNRYMTRKTFIDVVVMNLMLYGAGNSVVKVHTQNGLLGDLEPIAADRVSLNPMGDYGYEILIDGVPYDPDSLLHFVYNPDRYYPWKGQGLTVSLRDVANNLKQARATEKGFMESKWKPSMIIKVDALTEEFSDPEGREKLLDEYVKTENAGEPWLLPADQFQVEQIRPLSLADLAINDTVQLDKKTIASIIGVPAFVLGVGTFNEKEWNNFVSTKVKPMARNIEQELTRKLLINPKWYWRFNIWSLLSYDLHTMSTVLLNGSDRGFVNGDEWRDRMNMPPAGLKEYRVLENYIPTDMAGQQKKLIQGGDDNG